MWSTYTLKYFLKKNVNDKLDCEVDMNVIPTVGEKHQIRSDHCCSTCTYMYSLIQQLILIYNQSNNLVGPTNMFTKTRNFQKFSSGDGNESLQSPSSSLAGFNIQA